MLVRITPRDLPGHPVVETLCFRVEGLGSIPDRRTRIPYAAEPKTKQIKTKNKKKTYACCDSCAILQIYPKSQNCANEARELTCYGMQIVTQKFKKRRITCLQSRAHPLTPPPPVSELSGKKGAEPLNSSSVIPFPLETLMVPELSSCPKPVPTCRVALGESIPSPPNQV